jgi:hypothetical protein
MFNNGIILEDLHNQNFNFKKFLNNKNFIIWKECSNLVIKIDSDISRLEFKSCNKIKIITKKILGGLILESCKEIELIPIDKIYNLELDHSEIEIKENYDNILNLINHKSKIIK